MLFDTVVVYVLLSTVGGALLYRCRYVEDFTQTVAVLVVQQLGYLPLGTAKEEIYRY